MHSDHLLAYLSSKDYEGIHGGRNTRLGKISFNFVDINQMMSKNPDGNIRKSLLEYYALKRIDSKVSLPQIVLNEFKVKKRPEDTIRRLKAGVNSANSSPWRGEYSAMSTQKLESSRKDKQSSINGRLSVNSQKSSGGFGRKSSLQESNGAKFAEATRTWIWDYKSCVYLMDCKLLKDILLRKMCSHYRLFKKIPIYSYTQGNDKDLATKQWSTCYLNKNPRSRYNLVIIGNFMRNNCRNLHKAWEALEKKYIYYHKIDKDNLSSHSDLQFIKKAQIIDSKLDEEPTEDFGIYLFGLKVELETLTALIENLNLLQSIISRHRCTFWFKQCARRKGIKKTQKVTKKIEKDLLPICKRCAEQELYKWNGLYYSPDDVNKILAKVFLNK